MRWTAEVGGKCLVTGCNDKYHAKSYCRPHYMAWKRHGNPLIKKKEAKGYWLGMECIFIFCDFPVKAKGLCRMHYQQHQRRKAKDGE